MDLDREVKRRIAKSFLTDLPGIDRKKAEKILSKGEEASRKVEEQVENHTGDNTHGDEKGIEIPVGGQEETTSTEFEDESMDVLGDMKNGVESFLDNRIEEAEESEEDTIVETEGFEGAVERIEKEIREAEQEAEESEK